MRSRKSEQTRERIIESAKKVFTDKGYFATNVVDIIREAGCGHGTFYDYFSGKDEVLMAVLADFIEDLDRMNKASRVFMEKIAFNDIEGVKIIVSGITDLYIRHSEIHPLYMQAAQENEDIKKLFDHFRNSFADTLASKIEDMKKAGKCKNIDPAISAQVLVIMLGFVSLAYAGGNIACSAQELSENITRMIFGAVNFEEEVAE